MIMASACFEAFGYYILPAAVKTQIKANVKCAVYIVHFNSSLFIECSVAGSIMILSCSTVHASMRES